MQLYTKKVQIHLQLLSSIDPGCVPIDRQPPWREIGGSGMSRMLVALCVFLLFL